MRSLLGASLAHYRAVHALVVAGVAVAVAVLAGALLVGASVRASLRELALARLGNTEIVVSSPTHFRAALADHVRSPEIAAVTPLLAVQASVIHEDSRRAAARVQVFGIDDRFLTFHGRPAGAPQGRDAWISPALAAELGAGAGDTLLLRVARPTDIPLSHLQGRREETSERVRVTTARVIDRQDLGEFTLIPSQGPALSMFVPLTRLQQDLDIRDSANALLVQMAAPLRDPVAHVRAALAPAVELEDLGLRVRTSADRTQSILESRTGLLPESVWRPAAERASDRGGTPVGALTYLANRIRANGREIPYSLITAIDLPDAERSLASPDRTDTQLAPIRLNEWAIEDLGVSVGDRVDIDYFLWSDQDGLQTRTAAFIFAGAVPMDGLGGDATLTPEYPGITDAGDVTSWDPPFPVDMKRVRKKDEDYWDRWRSAPKAFIPLAVGQRLWPSPFGTLSSLRTTASDDWPPVTNADAVLTVRDARGEALAAASGTTDFGEYFVYFSFFLVVSGLLLAGMFFALSVEQRARELGLLLAVGFRHSDVRGLLLREAAVLAIAGSVVGSIGAVGYAADDHVRPAHVVDWGGQHDRARAARRRPVAHCRRRGGVRGCCRGARAGDAANRPPLAASVAHWPDGWHVHRSCRHSAAEPGYGRCRGFAGRRRAADRLWRAGGHRSRRCILWRGWPADDRRLRRIPAWLRRPAQSHVRSSVSRFGAAYARWRPTRSVLSAALIAFACFVIVAVAAFRRDAAGLSLARESGTGGFVLMAESVAPLMHNPNTEKGRDELSLSGYDELDGHAHLTVPLAPR